MIRMRRSARRFGFDTLVITLLVVASWGIASAFPSVYPKGLTVIDAAKIQPGMVIYVAPDGILRAVDPLGKVVAEWASPVAGTTFGYARPLANGNFLIRLQTPPQPIGQSAMIEMTPAGNVVWVHTDPVRVFHHDQDRLPNGNTLILCSVMIDRPEISAETLEDDCVIEVTPAGDVVWQWQTADHFHEFHFSDEAKALIYEFGGDWGHANAVSAIPLNTSHADPRFKPGNLVISYRNLGIAIVDRSTGQITWFSDKFTIGQHHAHMLADDVPGGGNILVFDNGFTNWPLNPSPDLVQSRTYSRVIEIDPVNPDPDNLPYEYDATYSGSPNWHFFAHFISSAERQPNGNTLITEGPSGRIFEVTPTGEIVWEFVNPFFDEVRGSSTNRVFRAHKIVPGALP